MDTYNYVANIYIAMYGHRQLREAKVLKIERQIKCMIPTHVVQKFSCIAS